VYGCIQKLTVELILDLYPIILIILAEIASNDTDYQIGLEVRINLTSVGTQEVEALIYG
jgi:hypothetical protein